MNGKEKDPAKVAAGRRGGRATVARHGREHMSAIGKRGFARAVELGYGEWLAKERLRESYVAKYGTEPVLGRQQGRPRSTGQRGACSWPGCDKLGAQRHHVDGWRYSDDEIDLCDEHHIEFHRRYRAACKRFDPRRGDGAPTARAIALSMGLIDLGGIPA